MPHYQEHCEHSKEVYQEEGNQFHKWIDQYHLCGPRPRKVLHNKEGVEVGVQLFGEEARKHLQLHIKDDYGEDKIPTINQLRRDENGHNKTM